MFKVEHRTIQNNGLNMFKIITGHFLMFLLLILNLYLSTGSIIILTGFLLFTLHSLRCNDVEDVMMRRCNEYISNKRYYCLYPDRSASIENFKSSFQCVCLLGSTHTEADTVLKICSKFTREHPCQSVISIKLL